MFNKQIHNFLFLSLFLVRFYTAEKITRHPPDVASQHMHMNSCTENNDRQFTHPNQRVSLEVLSTTANSIEAVKPHVYNAVLVCSV